MPIVKMPNGQLVDMPDNPEPEMLQKFKDHLATTKVDNSAPIELPGNNPSTMDRLAAAHSKAMPEMVNAADTGLRKGLLGLGNLGLQTGRKIGEIAKPYLPQVPEGKFKDAVVGARDSVYNYMNPEDPKTATGKVISNLIASGSGGVVAPGNMGQNAAMGLAGGMGAEGAAKVFGDNPITRIVGSLLGSGIHGVATQEFNNKAKLAREMLSDVKDKDLSQAIQNQRDDFARGIPTHLGQAMPTASNIDTYANALANSPQGKSIAELLRDQPHRISNQAEIELSKLPGEILGPHTVANRVQKAATEVISTADKVPGKVWSDTFEEAAKTAGKDVPEDTIKTVVKGLLDKRDTYAKATSEYKALDELVGRFAETDSKTKELVFLTDASKLHRSLNDFKSSLSKENLANKGYSTSVDKFMGKTIREIKTQLGEALEPYGKANKAYAEAKKVFNDLKETEMGRLAQRRGAIAGQEANMSPIRELFNRGSLPGAPSEILHAADKMIEVGKGKVFVDAGKSHFAELIDKAGVTKNDRINDNLAENLTKVFGAPQRTNHISKGNEDILIGMARGSGISEDRAHAEGFRRFMSTVARAAKRPGTVSGTSKAAIDQAAEESLFKRLGQFSFLTPIRQPALRWSMYLKDDSLTAIDKMLTDPDQVANLILLGKQPTMNQTAQKSIMAILSANQAAHHSNLESK